MDAGRRSVSAVTPSKPAIYAEDPARNDLPQAGPLLLYREPSMPGIRVDAGVTEGSEVSVHYDPLLAKLIAWGETRDAARRRALAALRSYPILGIRTNIALLIELLEHPRFIAGATRHRVSRRRGRRDPRPSDRRRAPSAVEAIAAAARGGSVRDPPEPVLSDRPNRFCRTSHHRPVDLLAGRACLSPRTTSRSTSCRSAMVAISSSRESTTQLAYAVASGRETWVFLDGRAYLVGSSSDRAHARLGYRRRGCLAAPMPATVVTHRGERPDRP